jgi:hypothetical protein
MLANRSPSAGSAGGLLPVSENLVDVDDSESSSSRTGSSRFPALRGVKVVQIAAGARSSFVRTDTGRVLGWGANDYGYVISCPSPLKLSLTKSASTLLFFFTSTAPEQTDRSWRKRVARYDYGAYGSGTMEGHAEQHPHSVHRLERGWRVGVLHRRASRWNGDQERRDLVLWQWTVRRIGQRFVQQRAKRACAHESRQWAIGVYVSLCF